MMRQITLAAGLMMVALSAQADIAADINKRLVEQKCLLEWQNRITMISYREMRYRIEYVKWAVEGNFQRSGEPKEALDDAYALIDEVYALPDGADWRGWAADQLQACKNDAGLVQ